MENALVFLCDLGFEDPEKDLLGLTSEGTPPALLAVSEEDHKLVAAWLLNKVEEDLLENKHFLAKQALSSTIRHAQLNLDWAMNLMREREQSDDDCPQSAE